MRWIGLVCRNGGKGDREEKGRKGRKRKDAEE